MSADTSIILAKFTDWYRHTGVIQCKENMDRQWYKNNKERKEVISEYWWSGLFTSPFDCYKSALVLYSKENYVEYWIVDIWELPFSL